MGTDDYAAAYMVAEAAMNLGEPGPLRDLLAEDFTSMGFTGDEFIEGWLAGWTSFHSHGVVAFGPFLLDYGSGRRPDGSVGLAAGVLRFNAEGKVESHTAFVADAPG